LTTLFSGLSSGPNISFWYIVSRYIAARMTADAEIAPISFGAGKKPTMPLADQVRFAVNVPSSTRNSPTNPHRPGRPTEASTMTRKHAAKIGMPCYVFIPEDLERAKILATLAYGAKVVAVTGNYDDVNRLCSEVADALPWAFINVNMRPYYAEGSKSLGFEVAEQLGWRLPDHVVVPIASGALLTKIHRAFSELIAIGAVEEKPYRVSGAQPEGCRPVAQAFHDGAETVQPVKPDTIARSLAIGNPADGMFAMQVSRQTGGAIEWCTEREIVEGVRLLASTEGVFTETAGGVTVANLRRLVERGVIAPEEETVVFITGNGYKTVQALEGAVEATYRVAPDLDEFLAAVGA